MSFLSPWLLLGLLLLPAAVAVWVFAERRRVRYAVQYPNLDVLASVVPQRSWLRLVSPVLFLAGLALLLVALARPQVSWTVLKDKATVILVVDTSRSMQAEDVKPTRLGAAQEAIRTFLDQAPDDLQIGLVVFAGDAQVATPPTTDHELVEAAVDQIEGFLVFGGTAIGDALQTAVELGRKITEEQAPSGQIAAGSTRIPVRYLAQSGEEDGDEKSPVSILFLSDGAQTRGILQPLEGAQLAREAGIPVYTIALGTPDGVIDRGNFGFGSPTPGSGDQLIPVPPDPVTLTAIAEMTGGQFSEARTADALEQAYANLGSRLGREPGEVEVTFLFVALAAGLLVFAAVFSGALAPRLP